MAALRDWPMGQQPDSSLSGVVFRYPIGGITNFGCTHIPLENLKGLLRQLIIDRPAELWWDDISRALKPGGHLAVLVHTKDALEGALVSAAIRRTGMEFRDTLTWVAPDGVYPVLLFRKGMTEAGVAENVLKHGTGAINADASRIKLQAGEVVATPQGDPANRKGTVAKGFGITQATKSKFQEAQRESIEKTNTMGRWPTNLFLSHAPDCVLRGTKKVKGGGQGGAERAPHESWRRMEGRDDRPASGGVMPGYADADGLETVEAWECAENCPAAVMDRQSGIATAGTARRNSEIERARPGTGLSYQPSGTNRTDSLATYGDAGGASRYFATMPDWPSVAAWMQRLISHPDNPALIVG